MRLNSDDVPSGYKLKINSITIVIKAIVKKKWCVLSLNFFK